WVSIGADGRLVYSPDARGNLIPDYSYAGYGGGGVRLPDMPVKITLSPEKDAKDDSPRIQAAIDRVSSMPAAGRGLRGAVPLEKGTYNLEGGLTIAASGVVLRGQGSGTLLRAVMHKKARLISIHGSGKREEEPNTRHKIVDERVPVGAKTITLDSTSGL